jgi:hypothetical protein
LATSSLPGVAFLLGAAAAGFFVSAFGFATAGALAFFSTVFASASGFVFATVGDVDFLGFGAATAFFAAVLVLAMVALTAAVADLVASRGDLRVGPVAAFFAGILNDGFERKV